MSNNIRDIEEDIKGGRKDISNPPWERKSNSNTSCSLFHCLFMDCGNCINGLYKPLGISDVPRFKKTLPFKVSKGAKDPGYMRIAMKSTAMTNTIFGFYYQQDY